MLQHGMAHLQSLAHWTCSFRKAEGISFSNPSLYLLSHRGWPTEVRKGYSVHLVVHHSPVQAMKLSAGWPRMLAPHHHVLEALPPLSSQSPAAAAAIGWVGHFLQSWVRTACAEFPASNRGLDHCRSLTRRADLPGVFVESELATVPHRRQVLWLPLRAKSMDP